MNNLKIRNFKYTDVDEFIRISKLSFAEETLASGITLLHQIPGLGLEENRYIWLAKIWLSHLLGTDTTNAIDRCIETFDKRTNCR